MEVEVEEVGPPTTLETVCPEGVVAGEMLTIAADEVRPQRLPMYSEPCLDLAAGSAVGRWVSSRSRCRRVWKPATPSPSRSSDATCLQSSSYRYIALIRAPRLILDDALIGSRCL